MYCKNCGQPIDPNAEVCIHCGFKKGTGAAFCSNCGSQMQPGATFCPNCADMPELLLRHRLYLGAYRGYYDLYRQY